MVRPSAVSPISETIISQLTSSDVFVPNTATIGSSVFTVECLTNQAPTANAGGPYTVPEGGTVLLDGTGSSDPDPSATLSYEWNLDYDGVTLDVDATSSATLFDAVSLDGPDSRTVALRVTDSNGEALSIDTSLVTIANVAPTADAGPD